MTISGGTSNFHPSLTLAIQLPEQCPDIPEEITHLLSVGAEACRELGVVDISAVADFVERVADQAQLVLGETDVGEVSALA